MLVYFHNAHQALVGLPQGAGGLAILFCFILFLQHAPGACWAPPRKWWPSYFVLFVFVLF
jgi:hypothetical protein